MSDNLIDNLKSFNRKERFYLIGQMLGNPEFRMDDNQLDKISNLIGLTIPRKYFAAMDYHLDWIYASLFLTQNDANTAFKRNSIENDGVKIDYQISGTQEDVDFLLAFVDHENTTHIVMIEAKGDSYFTNAQLNSKNKRFKAIFGDEDTWPNVKPHFLLCSPKEPQNVTIEDPVYFMLTKDKNPIWFPLLMGTGKNKVTRCMDDDKNNKPSSEGDHWKVENRT
ncbi:hypothetical protein [Aeromonas veronii]|uniref:hypothetical protein n=2 Tax=Aeromonas veronii TaxID=654 RepID=UPI0005A9BD15|nr:hypothetical protein [Aeromonas veronii]MCJ8215408.1 hypothetical protein [Aeromonas veronii]MCJ8216495.1 hypothetical protein [Aeromonas veronii]OKP41418.1 hypothetical protein BJP22_06265 [Aeromonas veronii]USP56877.1 hypothetical protein J6598_12830 [Aeromonas veronii]